MSASIKKIKLRLHVADKGKDFGFEEGVGFRCGMYIIACRNVKKYYKYIIINQLVMSLHI